MSAARTATPRTTRSLQRSWLPWLPLVVVVVLALGVGTFATTGPATNEERVLAIAKTLKCQQCRGESVAESNADTSRAIYVDIAQRVERGQTDDQIRLFYAQSFGEGILLTPTSSGLTGLVWVIPVVALVLSLAGLAFAFRRWSEPESTHATDDDRALVRAALDRRAVGSEPEPADAEPPGPTELAPEAGAGA